MFFEAEYHATLGYGGSKIGSDTRLTRYWTSYNGYISHSVSGR